MASFELQSQGAYRPEVRLGPLGPELVGLVGNARLCDEHRPLQARKLSDGLHSMSQVVSKIYKPVMHPLMQVGPAPSSEHKYYAKVACCKISYCSHVARFPSWWPPKAFNRIGKNIQY